MASKYFWKYSVPDGFWDVLMDLVREILRDQPHDVVAYCAQYFKAIDEGAETWRYKGKIARFPIPPNKISHEEFLAMQEENYQGQYMPEYE